MVKEKDGRYDFRRLKDMVGGRREGQALEYPWTSWWLFQDGLTATRMDGERHGEKWRERMTVMVPKYSITIVEYGP